LLYKKWTSLAQRQATRSVFYKQIRIILRDFRLDLDRINLARNLNVLSLDQLMFKRRSGYLFGIVSNQSPSGLYSVLLSKAHRSGKVVFFGDSRSRISKSSIASMAHNVVHGWSCRKNHLNQNYWNVQNYPLTHFNDFSLLYLHEQPEELRVFFPLVRQLNCAHGCGSESQVFPLERRQVRLSPRSPPHPTQNISN